MSLIKKVPSYVWALLFGALLILFIRQSVYYQTIFVLCAIYSIAVSGLDILFGYSGQIALGHAMFYASGAYTSAILTVNFGWDPWLAMLAGVVVTIILAAIVAIPASNLVHQFLALLTIAAGNMMHVFLCKATNVTNAMKGIRQIPKLSIFGYELRSKFAFAILAFIMLVIFLFIKQRIVKSSSGRAFMAIRENTVAAGGMGINVRKYKIMAFVISAVFASVAGSMYAHFISFISPEGFSNTTSTLLMTMLLFGGMGNPVGPVFGASIIAILNESLQSFSTYKTLIYGALIMVSVLFMPRGCYGVGQDLIAWVKHTVRKRGKKNAEN